MGVPALILGCGGYCISGAQICQIRVFTSSALCGVWGTAPDEQLLRSLVLTLSVPRGPPPPKSLEGKTSFLLDAATTSVRGSGYKASCLSSFLTCSSSSLPSNPQLLMVKGADESPRTSGLVVQSLNFVQLFATPCTAQCQATLSFTISRSLLKLMSIELMIPSSHLILC